MGIKSEKLAEDWTHPSRAATGPSASDAYLILNSRQFFSSKKIQAVPEGWITHTSKLHFFSFPTLGTMSHRIQNAIFNTRKKNL